MYTELNKLRALLYTLLEEYITTQLHDLALYNPDKYKGLYDATEKHFNELEKNITTYLSELESQCF